MKVFLELEVEIPEEQLLEHGARLYQCCNYLGCPCQGGVSLEDTEIPYDTLKEEFELCGTIEEFFGIIDAFKAEDKITKIETRD